MLGISCLWGSSWSGGTVPVYGVTQFSLWYLRYRQESDKLNVFTVGKGSVSPVLGWCCSTNVKTNKKQTNKQNHCEDAHRESIYGLPWLVNWIAKLTRLDINWQWEAVLLLLPHSWILEFSLLKSWGPVESIQGFRSCAGALFLWALQTLHTPKIQGRKW